MTTKPTTHFEKVIAFGANRSLVGILTAPREPVEHAPAVVILNSGVVHRVGVNRLHVDLARGFASKGFASLRFDLSGIGDSGRSESTGTLEDSVEEDIRAATEVLQTSHGFDRFVLMGLCSGAHDALRVGLLLDGIVGLALIDLPGDFRNWQHVAHHYSRRVLHLKSWTNALWGERSLLNRILNSRDRNGPQSSLQGVRELLSKEELTETLGRAISKDIALRLIFTAGVEALYNHDGQFGEVFPEFAAHPLVSHEYLSGANHFVSPLPQRETMRKGMEAWLTASFAPSEASR